MTLMIIILLAIVVIAAAVYFMKKTPEPGSQGTVVTRPVSSEGKVGPVTEVRSQSSATPPNAVPPGAKVPGTTTASPVADHGTTSTQTKTGAPIVTNPLEDAPIIGHTATDPSITGAPSGSTTGPSGGSVPPVTETRTTMQPGPGTMPRTTPPTAPPPVSPANAPTTSTTTSPPSTPASGTATTPPATPSSPDKGSKPDKSGEGDAALSSGGQG